MLQNKFAIRYLSTKITELNVFSYPPVVQDYQIARGEMNGVTCDSIVKYNCVEYRKCSVMSRVICSYTILFLYKK